VGMRIGGFEDWIGMGDRCWVMGDGLWVMTTWRCSGESYNCVVCAGIVCRRLTRSDIIHSDE
jgi:hypothetical protein